MTEQDDHHLKQAFEALRREGSAGTPPFGTTVAAARARQTAAPRRRALGLAAVVVVAVAAVVVVAIAAFVGFQRRGSWTGWTLGGSSMRCLKCGEPMKSTERWCKACGSASWTRN